MAPLARVTGIAPQSRAFIELATSKVEYTSSSKQRCHLICKSEPEREANQQKCRRGAAEDPNTDI
ncbi:hypothetical protein THAOC_09855, partial [Thalassiosira oceanica]